MALPMAHDNHASGRTRPDAVYLTAPDDFDRATSPRGFHRAVIAGIVNWHVPTAVTKVDSMVSLVTRVSTGPITLVAGAVSCGGRMYPVPAGALLTDDNSSVEPGTALAAWNPLVEPVLARQAGVLRWEGTPEGRPEVNLITGLPERATLTADAVAHVGGRAHTVPAGFTIRKEDGETVAAGHLLADRVGDDRSVPVPQALWPDPTQWAVERLAAFDGSPQAAAALLKCHGDAPIDLPRAARRLAAAIPESWDPSMELAWEDGKVRAVYLIRGGTTEPTLVRNPMFRARERLDAGLRRLRTRARRP